jgi:hypothetical protein
MRIRLNVWAPVPATAKPSHELRLASWAGRTYGVLSNATTRRKGERLKRLALSALSGALLGPMGGAAAATVHAPAILVHRGRAQTQSTNWSGYAAYRTGVTFTDVKGEWIVPATTCTSSKKQYSSFWVGIDGYNSNSVEQTGTESDCTRTNGHRYYAWYEMYPNPSVQIGSLTITPGDNMSAEVSFANNAFKLTIKDITTGKTFTITKSNSTAARTSAEWVAEAPSSISGVLPLANFGTANFRSASATGNGHTGVISDSAWSNDEITMVVSHTDPTVKAQPSALNGTGNAFSVTWQHS